MANPILNVLDGFLTLVFPPRCAVCHRLQEPSVCAECAAGISPVQQPWCERCGMPFDSSAKSAIECPECREHPPAFDSARAAGIYRGKLRTAIHRFKYEGMRALAIPLAELIVQHLERPEEVDCLCPVPLHPAREKMRGFNQSTMLAERLSLDWQLPVEPGLLARTRNTTPQMELPAEERKRNIKGAFTASDDAKGRAVCLIDDVFTTGYTLRDCARALKKAGAARVVVITVARTD